jgi:hypothetical protein
MSVTDTRHWQDRYEHCPYCDRALLAQVGPAPKCKVMLFCLCSGWTRRNPIKRGQVTRRFTHINITIEDRITFDPQGHRYLETEYSISNQKQLGFTDAECERVLESLPLDRLTAKHAEE